MWTGWLSIGLGHQEYRGWARCQQASSYGSRFLTLLLPPFSLFILRLSWYWAWLWYLLSIHITLSMIPTPVPLPGKSHGRRSLVGCCPRGRKESNTTERLHFHVSLPCVGEGNGNPLQCSCLENRKGGGDWWATVSGVAQSRTRLKRLSSSSSKALLFLHVKFCLKVKTVVYLSYRRWWICIFFF